jgi:hypothetical protein
VQQRQIVLGRCIALVGGFAEEFGGALAVLRDADAILIERAEFEGGERVAVFGGKLIPAGGAFWATPRPFE